MWPQSFPDQISHDRRCVAIASVVLCLLMFLVRRFSAVRKRYILQAEGTHSLEVKKSKFLGFASRVLSHNEAIEYLHQVYDSKATHHCWACVVQSQEYCSDDGEPSGTAGSPILSAIKSLGIEDVMVVVRRYYGGTKLGTGGLARAYGAAAFGSLESVDLLEYRPETSFSVAVPLSRGNTVYEAIRIHGGQLIEVITREDGTSVFTLKVPLEVSGPMIEWIRNDLRGECPVRILGEIPH
jgi:putative IMPACT (imprinted ancient) family translation regulator